MARLRYRYLLPLGHALVDVIVLSHFIWGAHHVLQSENNLRSPTMLYAQETVERWDFRPICSAPPPDLTLLATGTLPAGLISLAVRPEANWRNCDRLWDPAWFAIHETTSLLFWFLVGWWSDSPGAPLRRLLGGYLLLRFALIPLCWLPAWSEAGARVQMLFWLVFFICVLVQGSWWLLRRLRPRP